MRISFDLDGTLVRAIRFPIERNGVPLPLRPFYREQLRSGAIDLMQTLARHGHSIWVYTTSLRSPFYVWSWFRLCGIRLEGVVNHNRHAEMIKRRTLVNAPSKWPTAFGIDLHIDDSPGVLAEGKIHGFSVIVIRPDDDIWMDRVLSGIRSKDNET